MLSGWKNKSLRNILKKLLEKGPDILLTIVLYLVLYLVIKESPINLPTFRMHILTNSIILIVYTAVIIYFYRIKDNILLLFQGNINFKKNKGHPFSEKIKFSSALDGIKYGPSRFYKDDIFYGMLRGKKKFLLFIIKFGTISILFLLLTKKHTFLAFFLFLFSLLVLVFLHDYIFKTYIPRKNSELKISKVSYIFFLLRQFSILGFFIVLFIGKIIEKLSYLSHEDISNIFRNIMVKGPFYDIYDDIALIYVTLTIGFLIVFYARFSEQLYKKFFRTIDILWKTVENRIAEKEHDYYSASYDLFFVFDPVSKIGAQEEETYYSSTYLENLINCPKYFFIFGIFFLLYQNIIKFLEYSNKAPVTLDTLFFLFTIGYTMSIFYILKKVYRIYLEDIHRSPDQ